jgi:hypothetical protein
MLEFFMSLNDRQKIKELIIKKMGNKLKKEVLNNNLEHLVDEYIENQEFIKNNGSDPDELPTKDEMKWWFQDRPEPTEVEVEINGVKEECYEVAIDKYCTTDKIAMEVFKNLYKFKWKQGVDVPIQIKALVRLNKIAETTKNKNNKELIEARLSQIALIGVIRFYHMERKPYLCPSQINRAISFFKEALCFIDTMDDAKYKDTKIHGEFAIFDAFNTKEVKSEKKEKKRRKKTDQSDDAK